MTTIALGTQPAIEVGTGWKKFWLKLFGKLKATANRINFTYHPHPYTREQILDQYRENRHWHYMSRL